MFGLRIMGAAMLALPAVALAQVGPNPAVPGGSQSPTVGGGSDIMTAPQDVRVGARATGQVVDRSTTTTTDTTTSVGTARPGSTMTPGEAMGAGATTDTDGRATGTGMGTQTRTKTGTKGMTTPRR